MKNFFKTLVFAGIYAACLTAGYFVIQYNNKLWPFTASKKDDPEEVQKSKIEKKVETANENKDQAKAVKPAINDDNEDKDK